MSLPVPRSSPFFSESPEESSDPLEDRSVMESDLQEISRPIILIAAGSVQSAQLLEILDWLREQLIVVLTEADFWAAIEVYSLQLLILDRSFAGDGQTLCRQLRRSTGHHTLPILLLGDRYDSGFIDEAFAVGATDYLNLPLQAAEVCSRVKTQLALMSLQRRVREDLDHQHILNSNSHIQLLLALQGQLRSQSERLWAKNILLEHEVNEREEVEQALRVAHAQSDRLLLNILPAPIAERLKSGHGSLADRYEEATILFADIVDFTPFSSQLAPLDLMQVLNEIFSCFDRLVESFGLEKIKTIGDAYMVVGGVPLYRADHAEAVMELAIAMRREIRKFKQPSGKPLRLRIGINTGAVVAGVIGIHKFSYDLWGDAVNVASRMESQGLPGRIQVTENTYHHVRHLYNFEEWLVNIKGKGQMTTYFLVSRKSQED
ncbi:MAG: adenylate/guanylate cyclase domain-containing protein [Prochlorotrichaceae cyanobacterium]